MDEERLRRLVRPDCPEENFEAFKRAVDRILVRYPIPKHGYVDNRKREREAAIRSAAKVLVGEDSPRDASQYWLKQKEIERMALARMSGVIAASFELGLATEADMVRELPVTRNTIRSALGIPRQG